MTSAASGTTGFIGRRPELAVLAGALEEALSDKGQLEMVTGKPGIGKTRLSHELADLSWTCYDYAEILLKRNDQNDHAKAIALLHESLSISTELGMRPLMERVAALQEKSAARPVRASAYPDGLTQREIEVVRLVAAGKKDREIGEELFISVKPVGNHMRNILNKTDSANRTEAAAYAIRRGLAPEEESWD